jgi:hypothetical protein
VLITIPKGMRAEPGRVSIEKIYPWPRAVTPSVEQTPVDTLKKRESIQPHADPCLIYCVDGKEIVEFYVDYLYSASATKEIADDLGWFMNNHFKVTSTGVPHYLLSMEVC